MSKKRSLLTVNDVVGAWAIVPTPALDGAEKWSSQNTVDIDETVKAVNGLIDAGVDGLLTMGTLGECATLTWDEKKAFMAAIVETVAERVPVFVGTTSLNTRQTIQETMTAHDMGADGTMLGVPMWCEPTVDVAVNYYKDVAEACPGMAICVYDNKQAFKFEFPREFWARVSTIPQIVTAKYSSFDQLLTDIHITKGRIRFLPIDAAYYGAARMDPEFCKAFWTSGAVCGPSVAIRLRDLVSKSKETGDWEDAKTLSGAIGASFQPLFPNGSFKEFSKFNIGLEKARMNAAGWMKAGPTRPPYHLVPEEHLEGARKSGQMWAALHNSILAEGST